MNLVEFLLSSDSVNIHEGINDGETLTSNIERLLDVFDCMIKLKEDSSHYPTACGDPLPLWYRNDDIALELMNMHFPNILLKDFLTNDYDDQHFKTLQEDFLYEFHHIHIEFFERMQAQALYLYEIYVTP